MGKLFIHINKSIIKMGKLFIHIYNKIRINIDRISPQFRIAPHPLD